MSVYVHGHADVGTDLGDLYHISTHLGADHIEYAELRFRYGRIDMTAEGLRDLVDRGREALISLPTGRRACR